MSALAMCTCGHVNGFHLTIGCVDTYRGMHDHGGLCDCPRFTAACDCPTCTRETP